LLDSSSIGRPLRIIRTEYLPANTRDAGAPAQVITVQRLELPRAEDRLQMRTSQLLDVMEVLLVIILYYTSIYTLIFNCDHCVFDRFNMWPKLKARPLLWIAVLIALLQVTIIVVIEIVIVVLGNLLLLALSCRLCFT